MSRIGSAVLPHDAPQGSSPTGPSASGPAARVEPSPTGHGRLIAPIRPVDLVVAAIVIGIPAAGLWAAAELRINLATFVDGAARAESFLSRTLPLDFPPVGELLLLTGQTLSIVIMATVVSVVLSVPLSLLAAGPSSPSPALRFGARTLIVVARAVPDIVLAIVFVRIFGIGSLTGVLAMGLHSVGMVAKLYGDAIEQIDPGPPEALRATGATRLQRIVGAMLPPVLPAFVAVGLHRLDINLRVSVVLGFVGVEGLGFAIAESLDVLDYRRGLALALVVLILCVVVEIVSGSIRAALLGRRVTTHGPVGLARWLWHRRRADRATTIGPVDPRDRSAAALASGRVSPPWDRRRIARTGYVALAILIIVGSAFGTGIDPVDVLGSLPQVASGAALFWPPSTGGMLPLLLEQLWVTVMIALAALVIALALSLPLGALAARNVAPHPAVGRAARMIILGIRGVPELILAIVFVVMTGLGEVAGAVALGVGGVGLLGKLIADSLEEIDPGPLEALTAAGAGRLQVFVAGVLPAGARALVGHSLYLLDTSIRSATLLGIVGAGGIGFYLMNSARVLEFGVVTMIVILIFATVMLVELLAIWLRSRW